MRCGGAIFSKFRTARAIFGHISVRSISDLCSPTGSPPGVNNQLLHVYLNYVFLNSSICSSFSLTDWILYLLSNNWSDPCIINCRTFPTSNHTVYHQIHGLLPWLLSPMWCQINPTCVAPSLSLRFVFLNKTAQLPHSQDPVVFRLSLCLHVLPLTDWILYLLSNNWSFITAAHCRPQITLFTTYFTLGTQSNVILQTVNQSYMCSSLRCFCLSS